MGGEVRPGAGFRREFGGIIEGAGMEMEGQELKMGRRRAASSGTNLPYNLPEPFGFPDWQIARRFSSGSGKCVKKCNHQLTESLRAGTVCASRERFSTRFRGGTCTNSV